MEDLEDLGALKQRVYTRLRREKRWDEAEPIRDRMMRELQAAGTAKEDAQRQTYTELDRMFPPLPPPQIEKTQEPQTTADNEGNATSQGDVTVADAQTHRARAREDGATVIGLGDLPENWPTLAPNASLAQEIQWVQANRLRCVTENGDQAIVDLSLAMSPAPSYAALGWLETSIRAYTKFVDVAAKATASLEDEREHIRREKIAIEEVRSLLAEMLDDESRV